MRVKVNERLYSLYAKRGNRWSKIGKLDLTKEAATVYYQDRLLAGGCELRPTGKVRHDARKHLTSEDGSWYNVSARTRVRFGLENVNLTEDEKMTKNRFDSAVAAADVAEWKDDGEFTITVKDDEGKVVYQNKEEKFKYPKVDGLANILRYFGAELTDDAITFIGEALKGEEAGKAHQRLVEVVNGYLYDTHKANAYAKVLNEHKPLSEESLINSQARMVRDFMRQSNVDAESAISTLKQFVPTMKDYTLEMFNANRGRV
jgi:hypothetical protein